MEQHDYRKGQKIMAERITGHTELIGLMAYPIRHSSSPAMHNEAFAKLGLDYAYLAFEVGNEELDEINPKLMKDIIKYRHHLDNDNWGYFKRDIGPRRYKNLTEAMARVNLSTIDAKVSIDLKRILRLPSSLHSKVSMKCMEVKNRETFDPLQEAVPKFVEERGE